MYNIAVPATSPLLTGFTTGMGTVAQMQAAHQQRQMQDIKNRQAALGLHRSQIAPGFGQPGMAGQYGLLNYIAATQGVDSQAYKNLSASLAATLAATKATTQRNKSLASSAPIRAQSTAQKEQSAAELQNLNYTASELMNIGPKNRADIVSNQIPASKYRWAKNTLLNNHYPADYINQMGATNMIHLAKKNIPYSLYSQTDHAKANGAPTITPHVQVSSTTNYPDHNVPPQVGHPASPNQPPAGAQAMMPTPQTIPGAPPSPQLPVQTQDPASQIAQQEAAQTQSIIARRAYPTATAKAITSLNRALPLMKDVLDEADAAIPYAGVKGQALLKKDMILKTKPKRYLAYQKLMQNITVAQSDIEAGLGIPALKENYQKISKILTPINFANSPQQSKELLEHMYEVMLREQKINATPLSQQIKIAAHAGEQTGAPQAPQAVQTMGAPSAPRTFNSKAEAKAYFMNLPQQQLAQYSGQ